VQSHESLRDLYEVSSKELDAVVDIARGEPRTELAAERCPYWKDCSSGHRMNSASDTIETCLGRLRNNGDRTLTE
ncbi:MAG: hypothetical protein M1140_08635, partial [Chloroflexi bacterium]|nr:hypothetical protein [Chloroflexota bacterium]